VTTPNVSGSYWTPALTQTAVKTASYTASPNQIVPVDTTSGSVTITLPQAAPAGSIVAVKMVTQGSTNTVTVTAVSGDVFNKPGGGTTVTLTLPNQGVILEYQPDIWVVLADDLPLSQVDSRYLRVANNLSDVASASTSLSNIGGLPLAGGTMSGAIAMGSHKITGLANGSASTDAAAFGQVPVIGGTTFGPVLLGAGSLSAAQTANLLVLHMIYIPVPVTLTGLAVANGGTATGNILAGLYSADGTSLLASSASTGQSGTSSTQYVAFSGTYAAAAGTYITGVIYSSSSATAPTAYVASPVSTAAQGGFSLPSSVTPPTAAAAAALAVCAIY